MIDREEAARAIAAFLRALGHEPAGDLEGTPERVADAWADDLLEGESIDVGAVLREGSITNPRGAPQLVTLRDLTVSTTCPHHLLPAHGHADVIVLAGDQLVGLGTVARALDALARRLTLQETIGNTLASLLVSELGARGALCRLRLVHTCLVVRGERKAGSTVETVAMAGAFAEAGPERDLALASLG